jgi:hypothetical protein
MKKTDKTRRSSRPPAKRGASRGALAAKVTRLLGLSGKNRVEEILADAQAQEIVRAIAEEELYFTFKEVGDHDGLPLLELASPEQRQYVTDLELWRKDEFNPERALAWVALLQERGQDLVKTWLREAEPELVCLLLKKWIRVHTWNRVEDPEEPPYFTLDQVYYLEFLEPRREKTLKGLLSSLAETDLAFFHQTLEDVAWHTDAEFEEHLRHFRASRLAEKGFPDLDEALSVYMPLSPERFQSMLAAGKLLLPAPPEEGDLAPEYALVRQPEGTLFRKAMSEVRDPQALDRIKRELAALANRVLVADGLNPEDAATLQAALVKVGAYVSIGLERLVSWDVTRAGEVLTTAPVTSLFQVGFAAVLEVQRQAEREVVAWLRECGLPRSFLAEPWNAQLQGLLGKRPKHHRGTAAGEPLYDEFTSLEQVREVQRTAVLARLVGDVLLGLMPAASWAKGWRSLGRREPEKSPLVTWRVILLSAFAVGVLRSRFFPERLTPAEIRDFLQRIWEPERRPPRVAAQWKEELAVWLAGLARRHHQEMEALVADLSSTLEEQLAEVTPERLAPRYLETLFLLAEEVGGKP